ncbi:hypothetical protein GCM10022245_23560 [Streptomyces mayteni]
MFCQPDGRPVDPRDDWQDWQELLQAAGVRDAWVHDGRHTSATLLLEYGVDVRIVMEILGHSDLRATTLYTHIATPLAEEAARRMGQALWGATATEKSQAPDSNVVDLGFFESRLRESNPRPTHYELSDLVPLASGGVRAPGSAAGQCASRTLMDGGGRLRTVRQMRLRLRLAAESGDGTRGRRLLGQETGLVAPEVTQVC